MHLQNRIWRDYLKFSKGGVLDISEVQPFIVLANDPYFNS